MKITINRREYNFNERELTVKEILDRMNFTFPMIVVKVNDILVKKEDYKKSVISENDKVEVIHLISGG